MDETRAAQQEVLARLAARGFGPSMTWVHQVAAEMMRLVKEREGKVMAAMAKALRAKPPSSIDGATAIQIANFVMGDVGRYIGHGSLQVNRTAQNIPFIDGLPPDIRQNEPKVRERVTGEIEMLLAEIVGRPAEVTGESRVKSANLKEVFIVHGRNEEHRKAVAAAVTSFGLIPVVLHEQANMGRTIIEKFEDHANVGFAVVILSGDDVGRLRSAESATLNPRPRQNVVLEFGFFLGKLGRKNVCALYDADAELPSDYDGVLWIKLDSSDAWKGQLRKEIQAAGLIVVT